ncbi:MAG: hypothetical protein HC857_02360 [Synechococcales cyanobacterium RU_4_20]|nr:hypothetical protein [Synechococcales cyanobacterium RU_4_20]
MSQQLPQNWLIFEDQAGTGAAVATALEAQGQTVHRLQLKSIQDSPVDMLEQLLISLPQGLSPLKGIVHCGALDGPAIASSSTPSVPASPGLSAVALIEAQAQTLWLGSGITSGVDSEGFDTSGFGESELGKSSSSTHLAAYPRRPQHPG